MFLHAPLSLSVTNGGHALFFEERPSALSKQFFSVRKRLLRLLFSSVCGRMQFQQSFRIKVFTAPAHGKMQMRRRGPARAAAEPQNLPFLNGIAFFDLEL